MQYDLALNSLVNAGGAFLFVVLGVGILAVAGRSRRGFQLGGFATAFGLTYVVANLIVIDGSAAPFALLLAAAGASLVFSVLLVRETVRGLRGRGRAFVGAMTAVVAMLFVVQVATFVSDGSTPLGFVAGSALFAGEFSLVVLLAALGARLRRDLDDPEAARHVSVLALAVGPFTVLILTLLYRSPTIPVATTLAMGLVTLAATAPFAVAKSTTRDPLVRAVYPTLCAAAVLAFGVTFASASGSSEGFGVFGVVRTFGAAVLAYGIVRHDLLRVPLPRLVVRRGSLATGALAILFIVAQIGQNFFSAQYGLLMGGIVAGTFLFAVFPIQRAIERWDRPLEPGASAAIRAPGAHDEAYRAAVRVALRDRRLTREEEVALADVAERLGIGAKRAVEIRHDVEAEKGLGP